MPQDLTSLWVRDPDKDLTERIKSYLSARKRRGVKQADFVAALIESALSNPDLTAAELLDRKFVHCDRKDD